MSMAFHIFKRLGVQILSSLFVVFVLDVLGVHVPAENTWVVILTLTFHEICGRFLASEHIVKLFELTISLYASEYLVSLYMDKVFEFTWMGFALLLLQLTLAFILRASFGKVPTDSASVTYHKLKKGCDDVLEYLNFEYEFMSAHNEEHKFDLALKENLDFQKDVIRQRKSLDKIKK